MIGFLTGGIGRWFVLAAALYMGYLYVQVEHYKHEYEAEEAVYAKFVAETKAVGLQAIADNKAKELQYAQNINAAITDRDAALSKLRQSTYSGRRASSENPASPAGSSQVCYDAPAFDAAFRQFGSDLDRFIQDARGYVVEGDSSEIDSRALLEAWPK